MRTWLRTSPIRKPVGSVHEEQWISKAAGLGKNRKYDVHVRLGKPMDILSLKSNMVQNFGAQVKKIRSTRRALYESGDIEAIKRCPICRTPASRSRHELTIYGALYHQCLTCSHYYVAMRPSKAALELFYAQDTHYAATYTNPKTLKTRVQQVATPKAEWVMEQFKRLYGRKPKGLLDVGAGSGHFVYACRNLGLKADGIELSQASRAFCKNNFDIELEAIDFVEKRSLPKDIEVITFWGVIEHVPNPMDLLRKARELLAGRKALVVAAVPRWDCFGTIVQKTFPASVVRHLDPLGHINVFTDNSIATAFQDNGLAPVAAWYFGMDAYELTMQYSHLLPEKHQALIDSLGKYIPALQSAVDQGQLSDEIVLAGKPVS